MKLRWLYSSACALGMAPCILAQGKVTGAGVYLSPALKLAGTASIETEIDRPFPSPFEVTVGNSAEKHTLRSCRDLLALGTGDYSTGTNVDDQSLKFLAARCVALDWLHAAHSAVKAAFRNFSFRQIAVRQLPPGLALAISEDSIAEAKEASEKGESILKVEPDAKLRSRSAGDAELIAPDWTAQLTVFAHGDFLGDGNEELLVRWLGSATGGSYKATQLFLLAKKNGSLVVVRSRTP